MGLVPRLANRFQSGRKCGPMLRQVRSMSVGTLLCGHLISCITASRSCQSTCPIWASDLITKTW